MITEDYRNHTISMARPINQITEFMVARDRFLSGWGNAPGNSYVAYDLTGLTGNQIDKLVNWMKQRGDFRNVHSRKELPSGKNGDHLAIYTPPAHVINA